MTICKRCGGPLLFWTWGCNACAIRPKGARWVVFAIPFVFTAAEVSAAREGR